MHHILGVSLQFMLLVGPNLNSLKEFPALLKVEVDLLLGQFVHPDLGI